MAKMSLLKLFSGFLIAISILPVCAKAIEIDFGNDESRFAKDGECDDPRFENHREDSAMAFFLSMRHVARDATDCENLFKSGAVKIRELSVPDPACAQIYYGNNHSDNAYDMECDDSRFLNNVFKGQNGFGMAANLVETEIYNDAADCRALCEMGAIYVNRNFIDRNGL